METWTKSDDPRLGFYGLNNGELHDLDITSDSREKLELSYRQAIAKLSHPR